MTIRGLTAFTARLRGSGVGARLARGALSASAISAIGMGISFVTQVTAARLSGPEQYGVYVYVLSWLNIIVFYAKFGIDNAAIRFMSQYRANAEMSLLNGFARYSQRLVTMLGLAIALAGGIALILLRSRIESSVFLAFLWLLPLLPITALLLIQGDLTQGLGRVVGSQAPHQIVRPMVLLLLLGGVWWVGGQTLSASTAVAFNLGASLVALVASFVILRRSMPSAKDLASPAYRTGEWLAVGRAMIAMSTMQLVMSQNTGTFLVGSLTGTNHAGVYAAANQLSMPLAMTLQAVLFVAAPMIAELFAAQNKAGLARVVQLASTATAAVAIPVFLVFVLFGRRLLGLYGHGFEQGYVILVVLGAANVVAAWGGGIAGYLLTMTEHEVKGVKIVGVSAVISLGLTLALLPLVGPVGAAVGTLVATIVRAVWMAATIRTHLGVSVWPTWRALRPARVTHAGPALRDGKGLAAIRHGSLHLRAQPFRV